MSDLKVSFKGQLVVETFDIFKNKISRNTIHTKAVDDRQLFSLAHELVAPQPLKLARTNLKSEQTTKLDELLQKLLKMKLPDKSYLRSMLTSNGGFMYMIAFPQKTKTPDILLFKREFIIDFYG